MSEPVAQNELGRYAARLEEAQRIKGVSLGRDAWRRLRKNYVAMFSLGFLVLLSVLAVLTPLLPLQPPNRLDTDEKYAAPEYSPLFLDTFKICDAQGNLDDAAVKSDFGGLKDFDQLLLKGRVALFGNRELNSWCGRDELGRDVLARLFWGARLSLAVALVAALVSLVIGVSYGAVSGYLGGRIDNAMMRFVDVLYAVPFIYVVLFLMSILGQPKIKEELEKYHIHRITIFFLVIGAVFWLTMARVVRGQVMSLKNEQFIEAARTIGAGKMRIIFRHLVPNVLSVIIVYITLTIPKVMLFEAFLSFLGQGVQEPDVSWGLLANAGVKVITPIQVYWWLVVYPSLALGLTLFSLNFLGDGLRDALDPRLKNK